MSQPQFDMTEFLFVPLTPVHVGGGEEAEWLPEDYRIRNRRVERVSARAVLARLDANERQAMLDWVAKDAQGAIDRVLGLPEAHGLVTETIPLGAESANELGSGKPRLNAISAFIRAANAPFLPGSSLKGALRTAWLARCARELQGFSTKSGAQLVQRAFALDQHNQTDTDPMRDVTVEDSGPLKSATRIDQVHTWKKKEGTYTFASVGQLHKERLLSVVDGGEPPLIPLAIGLRDAAVRKSRSALGSEGRKWPKKTPETMAQILAALNAHHAPLWQREVEEKFFKGDAGNRLRQALALFDHLDRNSDDPAAALIRLGWAGHAESKSVAGFRNIFRPQSKTNKYAREGSTRHVLNLNGHPAPFGWALLVRKDRWQAPQAWLKPPAPGAHAPIRPGGHARSQPSRPQTVLGSQLRYARGQKILLTDGEEATLLDDVTATSTEVRVDFFGDIETIKVSEIKGPA